MHAITVPCPSCGSVEVRAARWQITDALGLLKRERPLFCIDCGDRFWASGASERIASFVSDGPNDVVIRFRRPSRWFRALLLLISDPGHSRLE